MLGQCGRLAPVLKSQGRNLLWTQDIFFFNVFWTHRLLRSIRLWRCFPSQHLDAVNQLMGKHVRSGHRLKAGWHPPVIAAAFTRSPLPVGAEPPCRGCQDKVRVPPSSPHAQEAHCAGPGRLVSLSGVCGVKDGFMTPQQGSLLFVKAA